MEHDSIMILVDGWMDPISCAQDANKVKTTQQSAHSLDHKALV